MKKTRVLYKSNDIRADYTTKSYNRILLKWKFQRNLPRKYDLPVKYCGWQGGYCETFYQHQECDQVHHQRKSQEVFVSSIKTKVQMMW